MRPSVSAARPSPPSDPEDLGETLLAQDLLGRRTFPREREVPAGLGDEVLLIDSAQREEQLGPLVEPGADAVEHGREHVPKSLICGLDAVALDTALWLALQARFAAPCVDRATARLELPPFEEAWGRQRLQNPIAAWRDQLLEILGAMGLREVRRLRGELGRCMFQKELEAEAFAGIEGYAR